MDDRKKQLQEDRKQDMIKVGEFADNMKSCIDNVIENMSKGNLRDAAAEEKKAMGYLYQISHRQHGEELHRPNKTTKLDQKRIMTLTSIAHDLYDKSAKAVASGDTIAANKLMYFSKLTSVVNLVVVQKKELSDQMICNYMGIKREELKKLAVLGITKPDFVPQQGNSR